MYIGDTTGRVDSWLIGGTPNKRLAWRCEKHQNLGNSVIWLQWVRQLFLGNQELLVSLRCMPGCTGGAWHCTDVASVKLRRQIHPMMYCIIRNSTTVTNPFALRTNQRCQWRLLTLVLIIVVPLATGSLAGCRKRTFYLLSNIIVIAIYFWKMLAEFNAKATWVLI